MQMIPNYTYYYTLMTSPVQSLTQTLWDINLWKTENILQLNKDKTGILIFGAQAHRQREHHEAYLKTARNYFMHS